MFLHNHQGFRSLIVLWHLSCSAREDKRQIRCLAQMKNIFYIEREILYESEILTLPLGAWELTWTTHQVLRYHTSWSNVRTKNLRHSASATGRDRAWIGHLRRDEAELPASEWHQMIDCSLDLLIPVPGRNVQRTVPKNMASSWYLRNAYYRYAKMYTYFYAFGSGQFDLDPNIIHITRSTIHCWIRHCVRRWNSSNISLCYHSPYNMAEFYPSYILYTFSLPLWTNIACVILP